MRLTFLGTSASEGFPNAFCDCSACQTARRLSGANIRRRSSALLNNDLLIDVGPDLMAASSSLGIPLHGLRYALQTHEHHDHLEPSHFFSRSAACAVPNAPSLEWCASPTAIRRALTILGAPLDTEGGLTDEAAERLQLTISPIRAGQTQHLGPYRVTAVAANHGGDSMDALLYAVERNGQQLFYGTDTGPLPDTTWIALAQGGWRFHTVVLDHTFGFEGRSTGHLNGEQFLEHVAAMRAHDLTRETTRFLATHFGHHSHPSHEHLTEFATSHGYEIAYDGLAIQVGQS